MVRSALSKVAWVGRTASMVFGLALVLALLFGVATTAFGANGGNFVLGKLKNAATQVTGLVGNVDGAAALRVTNPNAGTNDTALDLRVQAGEAPMKVNSATRVANLNAATAGQAESAASADTATNAQNAANADTLDNKDSTEFLGKTEKAADADKLDGKDSTEFANATHDHSGGHITSGTVAEARIDSLIARDSEVSNGFIQGRGSATQGARAVAAGSFLIFHSTPDLTLSYSCPASDITNNNGLLRIRNISTTETVNLFSDNGGTNPNHYGSLNPGTTFDQGGAASGEYVTFSVQGSYVATIQVFSVHRASDNSCHVQSQALTTR